MAEDTLPERVERLELAVQGLEGLPAQVQSLGMRLGRVAGRVGSLEVQVSQLRDEMRSGFSAARKEVQKDFGSARDDMLVGLDDLKRELGGRIDGVQTQVTERTSSLESLLTEVLRRLPEPRA